MTTIILRKELIEALADYKYFLNRKYPYKAVLNLIVQRYSLTKPEKSLLYRCVHDNETASTVKNKVVSRNSVANSLLIIDGFNVLITISSALECYQVFLCDDGIVRDIMKSYRKFKFENKHIRAIELLINEIADAKPYKTIMFFDKQISFSGKVAKIINNLAKTKNLNLETELVNRNDSKVIEHAKKGVVSSSDIVILLRAPKIFDISQYIIRKHFPHKIVNIEEILKSKTGILKK